MCATHASLVARVVDRPLAIQFFVSNPRTSMLEDRLFIDFMKSPNALGTTGRKAIITDYAWLPLDFARIFWSKLCALKYLEKNHVEKMFIVHYSLPKSVSTSLHVLGDNMRGDQ